MYSTMLHPQIILLNSEYKFSNYPPILCYIPSYSGFVGALKTAMWKPSGSHFFSNAAHPAVQPVIVYNFPIVSVIPFQQHSLSRNHNLSSQAGATCSKSMVDFS